MGRHDRVRHFYPIGTHPAPHLGPTESRQLEGDGEVSWTDGKVGLNRRRSRRSASERGSAEMAWRFGPGNGRAAGGLCDGLRNEFRGGSDVCRDGLRASIKRQKVSQGSEHVDPWNSGRPCLFHERARRVEPDFAPPIGFGEGVRWFRRPVMQPRQQHCNRNGLSPGAVTIEPRW